MIQLDGFIQLLLIPVEDGHFIGTFCIVNMILTNSFFSELQCTLMILCGFVNFTISVISISKIVVRK